jgi:serine/threonine protein kinase
MTQLQSKTDQYNIIEERGQGGFGITYRAKRARDDHEVIVKTLRIERMKEWKSFELFEREANVMRSLSHPNIPAYVDYFTEESTGLVAIVQEYIEGQDLRQRMKSGPRLTEPEMLSWLSQVLDVLIYLHQLSPPVIHRDISPKNILLRPDGKAYLIDFGAVQAAVLSASTLASTSAGTFGYAPLEQFMGRAFPQSDLYGLAMTYLAVSTGKEPEEFPLQGIKVDIRALGRFDARLQLLLEAMTEPDPGKRLGDAREALERLSPLLPKAASPQPSPRRDPPRVNTTSAAPHERPTQNQNERARVVNKVASAAWIREQLERQSNIKPVKSPPTPRADSVSNFVLSADGTQVLFVSWEKNASVDLETLEVRRQDKLTDKAFNDEESCVSPDLRLLARKKGSSIQIVKADDNKNVLQSVNAEYATNLAFSPDGHFLMFTTGDEVMMLGQRGEKLVMPGQAAAFSADGRLFALAANHQVKVGEAHIEGNKIIWGRVRTEPSRGNIKRITFSHDQTQIAVLSESNIYLLAIHEDTKPSMLNNIPRGETEPTNIGFTSDDRFVVVCGEFRVQRYSNRTALGAFFWRRNGTYWGSIAMSGGNPLLQMDSGFLSYVKADNKAPDDQSFWWRDEVRGAFKEGSMIGPFLSAEDRASIEDFEARYSFLNQLRKTKVLTSNANLTNALNATTKATPYLPLIMEAANQAADGPRFGSQQDAEPMSAQKIAEATAKFMKRPKDEIQVLLEDHLRRLDQEEAASAPPEREPAQQEGPPPLSAPRAPSIPAAASSESNDRIEAYLQEAKRLEQKEDSKWFRRKDYSQALELFTKAAQLESAEGIEGVRRITEKMS